MTVLGFNVFLATAFGGLIWANARGKLRPNPFFGIRIPATLRSPEAWRAGHAAARGILTALVALHLVMAVVSVAIVVGGSETGGNVCMAVTAVLDLIGVVAVVIVAGRAAAKV